MSMLERLRRGAMGSEPAASVGNGIPAVPGIEVETFEYVRVGRTALARVSGRWTDEPRDEADLTLVVRPEGGSRHRIGSIGESPGVATSTPDEWRAAFPMTLEIVEHAGASFELDTPEGTIPLPRPALRGLYMHEAQETAEKIGEDPAGVGATGEDVEELEARVREAEAGLRWTQGQLGKERDRRRALEQDIEGLRRELDEVRADRDKLLADPDKLKELERQVAEHEAERERFAAIERDLGDVTAERDKLKEIEPDAKLVAEERERRRALERQVSELAVDREKIRALDDRVAQLGRELEEAREGAAKKEAERGELHDELIRVRADSEATITRLTAEVEAVRKLWAKPGTAPPETSPEAETEPASDEVEPGLSLDDVEEASAEVVTEPGEGLELEEPDVPEEPEVAEELPEEEPAPVEAEEAEESAEEGPPSAAEPSSGAIPCADCDATGSCARCDGRGKKFGLRCSECGGSGLCATCGGPGYVWKEEAAAS